MSLNPQLIRGHELTLDTFIQGLMTVPATTQFTVNGVTYTQPDLLKKVEEERAPYKAVRQLDTDLKKARAELKAKKAEIGLFVHALQTTARAFVGEQNPDITRFGFKVDKLHRQLSSEEAKARADKARSTREARHTMGSKQKKAVHGPTPTPPPAPSKTP